MWEYGEIFLKFQIHVHEVVKYYYNCPQPGFTKTCHATYFGLLVYFYESLFYAENYIRIISYDGLRKIAGLLILRK